MKRVNRVELSSDVALTSSGLILWSHGCVWPLQFDLLSWLTYWGCTSYIPIAMKSSCNAKKKKIPYSDFHRAVGHWCHHWEIIWSWCSSRCWMIVPIVINMTFLDFFKLHMYRFLIQTGTRWWHAEDILAMKDIYKSVQSQSLVFLFLNGWLDW